ncbi:hypothetical protein SNE40_023275 [Patella caerulea]|uniref:RRM domain-containing protein n=1 Tax=Patella caerulea TaxID=87958 RepID=A0AAN8FY61_PATCE
MSNTPQSRVRDYPTNSRLFVICGKGADENAFKEAFGKYGTVEDVWVVKDRRTNEDKGVVYVKMEKTSEAALAMEELNGRKIDNHQGTLKVVVASNKAEGSNRDSREDEKTLRLFVLIPKTFTEADLRKEFEQFGDIEFCNVVIDRNTGDNKGFGYVKYKRPYHAALAFESCNPTFKPKFADPPKSKSERENREMYGDQRRDRSSDRYGGGSNLGASMMDRSPRNRGMKRGFDEELGYGFMHESNQRPSGGPRGGDIMDMLQSYPTASHQTRLQIITAPGLSNSYLAKLTNLVPGLEYCDLNEVTGVAHVRYSNSQCAAYARDKLDGFEYPIGSRLMVRYPEEGSDYGSSRGGGMAGMFPGNDRYAIDDRMSGLGGGGGDDSRERVQYCNIPLPLPQPLRTEDTPVAQRLFIVCQPAAVTERVLRDAFCRFGNLIDVYLLAGRNYGYAKYAKKENAMRAIQNLHGQNLAGQRVKVLEAEPPKSGEGDDFINKKARY